MTKKATKLKATEPTPRRSTKRLMRAGPAQPKSQPQFAQNVIDEAQGVCGSGEEALSLLIANIADKLGEDGGEGAQMREFLSLILDTDPTLKEEILQGVSLRK